MHTREGSSCGRWTSFVPCRGHWSAGTNSTGFEARRAMLEPVRSHRIACARLFSLFARACLRDNAEHGGQNRRRERMLQWLSTSSSIAFGVGAGLRSRTMSEYRPLGILRRSGGLLPIRDGKPDHHQPHPAHPFAAENANRPRPSICNSGAGIPPPTSSSCPLSPQGCRVVEDHTLSRTSV